MSQTRIATVLFAVYFNFLNGYLNGSILGGLSKYRAKLFVPEGADYESHAMGTYNVVGDFEY